MLIPQPVEVDFAIPPKTGQRKTRLLRLLPEKLDAAKPGTKKVGSAIEKVESAIEKVGSASQKSGIRKPKKVKSALRLPEKRLADGFGSPQKSGIRNKKSEIRKRKPGSRGAGLYRPGSWTDGIMPCLDVMNH